MRTKWSLVALLGLSLVCPTFAEPTLENLYGFDQTVEDISEARRAIADATQGIARIIQITNPRALNQIDTLLTRVLELPPQLFLPEETWKFALTVKALLDMENLNTGDMTMIGVIGDAPAHLLIQESDLAPLFDKVLALLRRCLHGQSLREQLWLLLLTTEDAKFRPPPAWVPPLAQEVPAGYTLVENLKLMIAHAFTKARPQACERQESLGDCAIPHDQLVASYVHEILVAYFETYGQMLLALPTGRVSQFTAEETEVLIGAFGRQAARAGQIHWNSILEPLWQKLFGKQTRRFWPECGAAIKAVFQFWRSPVPQRPPGVQWPH